MASHVSFLCTLTAIIFLASSMNGSVEASTQFKVGDAFGWQQPPPNNSAFYTQWASMIRFHVSDSLVFEYKNDSVVSVDKWDYYHCDASDPITMFNNGNSSINLDQPGSFYFISGLYDHCSNGQKLMVQVISPMSVSAPSPSHRRHNSGTSLSLHVLTPCFNFMMLIALGVSSV
ncbi:mavicyanin-like [Prosopis cineraria]|uniref:mavicyanin-like n=1 Tax=Prosopis cineraria TaxID=364024 RepID=UPI002410140B|nr:mavicyanin-like [Prosopis cineraria]